MKLLTKLSNEEHKKMEAISKDEFVIDVKSHIYIVFELI